MPASTKLISEFQQVFSVGAQHAAPSGPHHPPTRQTIPHTYYPIFQTAIPKPLSYLSPLNPIHPYLIPLIRHALDQSEGIEQRIILLGFLRVPTPILQGA